MATPINTLISGELPELGSELYPARLAVRFHRMCLVSGGMTVVLGLAVLTAWALRVELVKSPVPGLSSMKPSAALGFVGSGTATMALALSGSGRARRLSAVAAMVPLLAGTRKPVRPEQLAAVLRRWVAVSEMPV